MGKKSVKMGKAIKRLKKKASKADKKINAPTTYENLGKRVSLPFDKRDRKSREGDLAEGSGVRTKSGKVRGQTRLEANRAYNAERLRRKELEADGTYEKREKARAKVKKLQAKKKNK